MEITKLKSLLMLPVLMLALAGCGSSSDDEDDACVASDTVTCPVDDSNDDTDDTGGTSCSPVTETVQYTSLPDITYTEDSEDESEGGAANDSKQTAQVVTSNSIISGTFAYGTDFDDYYVLSVSEGDKLELELDIPNSGTAALLQIYGPDYIKSDSSDDNNAVALKRLDYTVTAGITQLYILVSAYAGTGPYTLKITTPVEPETIAETITSGCSANLQGALTNAVNGGVVEGATLNLREGSGVKTGTVEYSVTSDAQGQYSFTDINAGEYTIEIVKADYITHYLDIALADDKTAEKKFQLSPTLAEGEELRLVMSWGAQPYILDSYLNGPNGSGGSFTVKYYSRTGTGASLDRDATNGYGPETMTFTQLNEGTYTYWINDYTNRSNSSSTALGVSGANVTVYDASGIVKQYKVPSGTGTKWNVLTITVNGSGGYTINDVNTLGNWSESP